MPHFTKGDADLIRFAASFVNLRATDFVTLTDRSLRVIQHRLKKLLVGENGTGYFYRIPNPANPFEQVYFLSQKGWDEALRLGFVNDEVNANREKSEGQVEHDLVLTDFHRALHFSFGEQLHWSQLWKNRYTRWGKGPFDYVNADAFFYIEREDGKFASFFVEVENQKGVEEPLRKMEGYVRFAESGAYQEKFEHPDFRVIFLRPSTEMVRNLVEAAAEKQRFATRRFWITSYADMLYPRLPKYLTPRDRDKATYTLAA
jgi:hypothetical protein